MTRSGASFSSMGAIGRSPSLLLGVLLVACGTPSSDPGTTGGAGTASGTPTGAGGGQDAGLDASPDAGASARLLLYSTMDTTADIAAPTLAAATYPSQTDALPGLAYLSTEPGQHDDAIRFDGTSVDPFVDGLARFHGDNFDLTDGDSDGGRLDFWLKFNQDPHNTFENLWFARANFSALGTGQRLFDVEYVNSELHIYVYSMTANNERTNYAGFSVSPRTMPLFANQQIQQGEWHQFTLLWRRNGGPHKAELHLFVDGTQEGCLGCSDYNGNLPEAGEVSDLFLSPALPQSGGGYQHALFSLDEIYSFDGWDTSGLNGRFATLERPEGVTPTYPLSKEFPWWASPVPVTDITFEFFAINHDRAAFDCDLYVDDSFVETIATTTEAHAESSNPVSLSPGSHTYQLRCDGDRLQSDVTSFDVEPP